MSKLLIVESPAKAKTIKKYLGKDFNVVASVGHVRDLYKTRLSVDVKNNFKPTYSIIKGKEDIVKDLKKRAKESEKVYLATDPDREGEAISWHLANILKLNPEDENRVTFNEITEYGIKNGMINPRKIDMDLVNAQQARRILDRLVGYKLSPFVAQKIRRGLSAGRVQSVAVKIIVDREKQIRNFKPEEYWSIDAKFSPKGLTKTFNASFYGIDNEKVEISNEKQADDILSSIETDKFYIKNVKKSKRNISPPPPFITSTLQQDASRKLGFQAKRTMKVAQELYEGMEIEALGALGLITYMRTDSLRISNEAIKSARNYIKDVYGSKYVPAKERIFKSKKNAQDAHEAIRPTIPELSPDRVKSSLSSDQYKLYTLIWSRFIASQMSKSVQDTTKADVTDGKYVFKASGYTVSFDGFTALYQEGKDEKEKTAKALPAIENDMKANLKNIEKNQHFTLPPQRYTEASLIKTLEEDGIGRPSTYATVISTIISKGYITRDKKRLIPSELGEVSSDLIEKCFPKIVNVKFTAKMEQGLDIIEDGNMQWETLIDTFYTDFAATLKKAKEDTKDLKITLKEDQTDIICEKCGKQMVIKTGRYGRFIACPGYPECDNVKKLVSKTGVKCPECSREILERKTKKGRIFYGCEGFPDCRFASWDKPTNQTCPQCGGMLFEKKGKAPKLYCKNEDCKYTKVIDENDE
ncbi:MAG: type I DNA topoisomerase [Clostridia bacterium]|nr:type I DNA topoisomerase [Clostridia bacterium]